MSERDDRPAGEPGREGQEVHLTQDLQESAHRRTAGALDGAAAAGSLGSVGGGAVDSELPTGAPGPTSGQD